MGERVEEQGGGRGKHCGQGEHEKEQDDERGWRDGQNKTKNKEGGGGKRVSRKKK